MALNIRVDSASGAVKCSSTYTHSLSGLPVLRQVTLIPGRIYTGSGFLLLPHACVGNIRGRIIINLCYKYHLLALEHYTSLVPPCIAIKIAG